MPAHPTPVEAHNRPVLIFLTVCTARRASILADSELVSLLTTAWREAEHWRVGHWVILPDHLHLFCAPSSPASLPLANWVRHWKSSFAKRAPSGLRRPLWQGGFWDRQMRHGESYAQKWDYVQNNPVRHGLCNNPEEWPFQGELTQIEWHDP